MGFKFTCKGHHNILSTHKNTIEFTKDSDLSKRGDCILGINANFDKNELLKFIKKNKEKKIFAKIFSSGLEEEFNFYLNPSFKSENEIVIRRGEFLSDRTLGIRCNKSAVNINRALVESLKKSDRTLMVEFNEAKNFK